MKEASTQAEPVCPDSYSAKLNLLRGYLALCYPDEQRLNVVEKLVEAASVQSIKHWRRLPQLISHAHVPLLQVGGVIIAGGCYCAPPPAIPSDHGVAGSPKHSQWAAVRWPQQTTFSD